jgi:hypothetical protein
LELHVEPHLALGCGRCHRGENGAIETKLMAIFGRKTMKEAERCTRAARQKIIAGSAMRLLVPEQN